MQFSTATYTSIENSIINLHEAREHLIRKLTACNDPRTRGLVNTSTKLAVPATIEATILARNVITINWNYISTC
jgi:hypothetical protein